MRCVIGVGLCVALFVASHARAQGAAALGNPVDGSGGLTLTTGRSAAGSSRSDGLERSDDPMGSFGIGLKMGVGFAPSMRVDSPVMREIGTPLGSRTGLLLALPINLGDGHGAGLDVEPFLLRYGRSVAVSEVDDSITVYGGYAGPAVRFQVQRVYLSVGLGAKFGWIDDELFDVGMDLFGRVPITATYYVSDKVGLTFELGLAYGVTGVKARQVDDALVASLAGSGVSASTLASATEAVSWQFGRGFAMDSTLGVRFP